MFALLAMAASAPARAEMAPKESCIARISAGETVDSIIAKPAAFDCRIRQSSLGSGDYLVRLRFPPAQSEIAEPLMLRMSSVWMDTEKVHFRYADGSMAQYGFAASDIADVLSIGAIFEIPVPARSAPLDMVYVEVRGSANLRGVVLGPRLVDHSESHELRIQLTMLYSAFAGMALVLIVYNLSLWATMRHRFQLYYCAMVTALAGYAFTSSGMLVMAFPEVDNTIRLRCNYALLMLSAAMALQFVRYFFGGRIVGRNVVRAIHVATGLAALTAAAFMILAPWQIRLLDYCYYVAMLGMLCMIPPILFRAWRARSSYLPLVLVAWSAPLITSFLRALHGFNLIGYNFWLDNGNLVALSLEALVSSVLVTARLRELSYERDHARAGEEVARRLAATDPLTGLLNRRAFLDLAIGRTQRQRLLLIDIDHFKSVNDRLGHAGGDDVLHAVASAIQSCRPARSLAVRLGGEEFAVLLPRSAFDQCTANMILQAVRECAMPQGIQVTVSIGFADGSVASEEDWKRLYRLADTALYRAKSDGRDRACRATDFRAAAA